MNAPIHPENFELSFQLLVDRARLALLDEFFELELAVGQWCAKLGTPHTGSSFGQRIKSLVDHPRLAENATAKQAKFIARLPESCCELLRIRNAVAHSRTREGRVEGVPVVLFETLSLALAGDGAVIPIAIDQIEAAAKDARRLASHLRNFLSQKADAEKSLHPDQA